MARGGVPILKRGPLGWREIMRKSAISGSCRGDFFAGGAIARWC